MSRLYRERWTYCGVMAVKGIALLLVNDSNKSTRAMIAYDDAHPVVIKELS